jgi:hypothetical protein
MLQNQNHSFQIRPGLRSRFQVLTRSSGFDRVNFFFLNQNDVVLVKKQKSTGYNRVFDRVLPGHTGQPQAGRIPGRLAGPGQAGFQNYDETRVASSQHKVV